MRNKLILRFSKKDITWLTDKTYKAKQNKEYCYFFPFSFKHNWSVISSCGYKYPNLFKGRSVLCGVLNRYLNLIVWDAENGQINIAATGFTITIDLPIHKTKTEERWWDNIGIGERTLKKTLIILEKLGYLTLSEAKPKLDYIRINLNIPKCSQSLNAGQLEIDIWEAENESHF